MAKSVLEQRWELINIMESKNFSRSDKRTKEMKTAWISGVMGNGHSCPLNCHERHSGPYLIRIYLAS